jgi:DNA-binding MarR family transcriptional regulator
MEYRLTDKEISLLKELKGAGGRSRNVDQGSSGLERLVRAGYVRRLPSKGTATRHVITDIGRIALDNTLG